MNCIGILFFYYCYSGGLCMFTYLLVCDGCGFVVTHIDDCKQLPFQMGGRIPDEKSYDCCCQRIPCAIDVLGCHSENQPDHLGCKQQHVGFGAWCQLGVGVLSLLFMSNERFWCHSCNYEVRNAILVDDEYQCPICNDHFVELYEEHEQDARPSMPLPALRPSPVFVRYPIMQMIPAAFPLIPVNDLRFSDMMTALFSQLSSNFPRRPRGVDVSTLETYTLDEGSLSHMVSAECAICQAELAVGDRINSLPCSHSYHNTCILPWLESHDSCPICRARIV